MSTEFEERERAAFEKWAQNQHWPLNTILDEDGFSSGIYLDDRTIMAWTGWLARARHDHAETERLREALDWQPIETAPKDMTQVLVSYICGKRRMVAHAQYTPRYTEENINSDCSEYCEEKDNYYTPEGWYEICAAWDDYSSMKMHYEPTHWMPLPEPPNEALARKELTSGT